MDILFHIVFGFLFLLIGGEVLVRGAVSLARAFGVSPFVIGLTVVAYGTSAPEMVVSAEAALEGFADIALGNVIGSNISNMLCVLGLTAMVAPIVFEKSDGKTDALFMLVCTALLFFLGMTGAIGSWLGMLLLTVLVGYTVVTFLIAKKRRAQLAKEQTEEVEGQLQVKLSLGQSFFACLGGGALLVWGGDWLIEGAVDLAKVAGLSEAVIGVTLIAFGSSAPELATSLVAALRKHSGIVLGNIVGSNIFNILGIMGITGVIAPVTVAEKFMLADLPVLMVVSLFLVVLLYVGRSISRGMGLFFLCGYLGYIGSQFVF